MSHNPRRLPVTLNGVSFQVDTQQLQRGFLPAQRQSLDTGREPGEQSLNPLGLWRKLLTDWSLGSGQEFQDLPDSSSRQFWRSSGVDVWTKGKLSLLRKTGAKATQTTNALLQLHSAPGYLYSVQNDGVSDFWYYTADPSATTPTWTKVTGTNGGLITSGNGYIYTVSTSQHIYRAALGNATASAFSTTTTYSRVAYVKDRLLAANSTGKEIWEVDAAGVGTLFHTILDGTIQAIVDAPNGIYVATATLGTGYNRGQVLYIGIKSDGSLATPIQVAELPSGEGISGIAYYGGVMVLRVVVPQQPGAANETTGNSGIRLAVINGDNTLTYGPKVLTRTSSPLAAGGEDVYMGVSESDQINADSMTLVRFRLSEFTEPLVPAYAAFLQPPTNIGFGTAQQISSVAIFQDDVYFTTSRDTSSLNDIYGPTSDKVASGYVMSGWIRYGVSEGKIPRAIDVRHEPLPAGASVKVYIVDESGNETLIGTSSTAGTVKPIAGPYPITGHGSGEMWRLKVEMNRATDTTQGPVVTSLALYSIPVPSRTEQFLLPLELATTVAAEGGSHETYDVDVVYDDLRDLVKNRAVVTLELGGESHNVTVENVELRPEEGRKWDDARTAVEGRVWVTCQTADLQVA